MTVTCTTTASYPRAQRWSALLAVLTLALASVLVGIGAPSATADTGDGTDGAIAAFAEGKHIYVDPAAGTTLDEQALAAKIGDQAVYIAVLPPNQSVNDAITTISQAVRKKATFAVFSGTQYAADSTVLCDGLAEQYLAKRAKQHEVDFASTPNATATASDWLGDVSGGPTTNCAADGSTADSDAGSVIPWVIAFLVVALAAGGFIVNRKRRQKQDQIRDRRAEVTTLYDRLGSEVQQIDAGDSLIARQAIADASDRYSAAGNVLSTADTDGDFDEARRACLEGLVAARVARVEMGLDEGDPIPKFDAATGEQLTEERDIRVGEQVYHGYPSYVPGSPLYYAGGQGVPGGWYSVPFWETVLIGSMFSGTWSGTDEQDYDDDDYPDERR